MRTRRAPVAEGDREVDVVVRGEGGVDLAEFDAETAQLDLEVGAADVLDDQRFHARPGRGACGVSDHTLRRGAYGVPRASPAHDVAGAVHPRPRHVRIGDEAFGGQARPCVIAASQLDARQIQLTRDTHRNRTQFGVQDQRLHATNRRTDGDRLTDGQRIADIGHDGGLGGPVTIVEVPLFTGITQRHSPFRDQLGRACLTTGDHDTQGVQAARVEGRQRGGRDERVRDPLGADQFRQFLAAVDARRHHDQRATRADRQQQLQHRGVEAGRGEMQCARIGIELVALDLFGTEVGEPGVGDHNTLGDAGRAGGVDDIGGVVGTGRRDPLGVGDRAAVEGVAREVFEHQPAGRFRQVRAHRGDGESEGGAGVGDHVRDAVGRVVRVDRNERGTGLGDRPFREVRIRRARYGHRDQVVGADAFGDQQARQAVRALIQLAIRQSCPLEHHRGCGGVDRDGVGEQFRQGPRGHGRTAGARGEVGVFGRVEDIDRADRRTRIGRDGLQHALPAHRDLGRGVLVEQFRGVGERQTHTGSTGFALVGERELEVEARDTLVEIQRRDGESRQFQAGALQVLERQHHLEQRVTRL
ncbi:hypothetical protein GCM10023318_05990 [Nocardia callitridis]|uniref:Uncharacterized protein n=1 Tax=Nocardia callitridis TaxID=648753 RepID=A0ABP9JVQ8_9NOCA